MAKKLPREKFDEASFNLGFNDLDTNHGGTINLEDIKAVILKKCKEDNLYIGSK